jgi:hypothetical protein
MRYVPENFDSIIAGASISANWDIRAIERLRIYNDSLEGGTITEEKAVIEAALERPGVSVVLLLVHPALTYSHEFRTVDMQPGLKWSALGSLSLWEAYKDMINIRLGRIPRIYDAAGTVTFLNAGMEMNVHMQEMWNAPVFKVDPSALQAYLDLVAGLRAHRIQIVFIIPPTSETLLQTKRSPMEQYVERMRQQLGAADLWIDFMSPEYEEFSRRRYFSDGVHLTADGAKQVVGAINTSINQWIAGRRLVVVQR